MRLKRNSDFYLVLMIVFLITIPFQYFQINQWFDVDELSTFGLITRDHLNTFWDVSYFSNDSPLYYFIAWIWSKLFGHQPYSLRSLGLIFYTFSICIFNLYLDRKKLDNISKIFFNLILFINPITLFFAVELKPYSLLMMSFLWLILKFDKGIKNHKLDVELIFITCLVIYSSFLGIALVLSLFLVELINSHRKISKYFYQNVIIIFIGCLPLSKHLWMSLFHSKGKEWTNLIVTDKSWLMNVLKSFYGIEWLPMTMFLVALFYSFKNKRTKELLVFLSITAIFIIKSYFKFKLSSERYFVCLNIAFILFILNNIDIKKSVIRYLAILIAFMAFIQYMNDPPYYFHRSEENYLTLSKLKNEWKKNTYLIAYNSNMGNMIKKLVANKDYSFKCLVHRENILDPDKRLELLKKIEKYLDYNIIFIQNDPFKVSYLIRYFRAMSIKYPNNFITKIFALEGQRSIIKIETTFKMINKIFYNEECN